MNTYKNVLIIGGGGLVGYHTARLLTKNNFNVEIVDNFSTSTRDNSFNDFIVHEIDASKISLLKKVYSNFRPNVVYNFASIVDNGFTIKNPLSVKPGLETALNVCHLSNEFGVELNVYASSSFVYGNSKKSFHKEESRTYPVNPYNISKIFGENIVNFYSKRYNLKNIILRYAPIYGPRRKIGPIYDFIKKAINSQPITLYGKVTRDYIYVEDVALANLKILKKKNLASNLTLNIGTGIEVSLDKIYFEICDILNISQLDIIYKNNIHGEIDRFSLNIESAKKNIDFYPSYSLKEGLKKTIDWVILNER